MRYSRIYLSFWIDLVEKWRGILELTGLAILSGSLIFVALQMQQDRAIALATLASERHGLHTSRFAAGIESDEYLTMYYALYRAGEWDSGELNERQIAAAELDALIWWAHANQMYDHYQEGLISEQTWQEQLGAIRSFSSLPAFKAVYEKWWKRSPTSFSIYIDRLLADGA